MAFGGIAFGATQHTIGYQRRALYAAEQIAKARQLFPATFYNGTVKEVVIREDGRLQFPGGESLYVRSSDLGSNPARVLMDGAPDSSLEVFSMDGTRLFSRTYVRPDSDAVAREHHIDLPPGETLLRLGDKTGVVFPDVSTIPLFINPDGIFNLPLKLSRRFLVNIEILDGGDAGYVNPGRSRNST